AQRFSKMASCFHCAAAVQAIKRPTATPGREKVPASSQGPRRQWVAEAEVLQSPGHPFWLSSTPAEFLKRTTKPQAPARQSLRIPARAQVALAKARHHHDNELAGILWPLGHLDGRPRRGAAADAAQHSFLARQSPAHLKGVVILHLDDLIDDLQVENFRNEPGADALDLVPAGLLFLPRHALPDHP